MDECLNWSDHIRSVRRRSLAALAVIQKVSMCLSSKILTTLYNIMPLFYPTLLIAVLFGTFVQNHYPFNLQRVQNYAMRLILKQPPRTSSLYCLQLLNWMDLYRQRCLFVTYQIHKCVLKLAPAYLSSNFFLTLHLVMTVL